MEASRHHLARPVDAALRRDVPPALEALFETWFDRIHRFCLSRTASSSRAEDAAAETFADAARLFADGRGAEVTESWLFTVARRRVIDQWRSAERHRRRLARVVEHTSTDQHDAAQIEFERDENVREALAALPERQRAAIVLRYVEEFSVAEVADALEVGYEAAESLLARGRRSFVAAHGKVSGR